MLEVSWRVMLLKASSWVDSITLHGHLRAFTSSARGFREVLQLGRFSVVRKGGVKEPLLASAVVFILCSINSFYMNYSQFIVTHLYVLQLL